VGIERQVEFFISKIVGSNSHLADIDADWAGLDFDAAEIALADQLCQRNFKGDVFEIDPKISLVAAIRGCGYAKYFRSRKMSERFLTGRC
jgi:hypothetical protein